MVAKIRGMNVSTTAVPITGPTTAVLWKGGEDGEAGKDKEKEKKRRKELCYNSLLHCKSLRYPQTLRDVRVPIIAL